MDSAGTAGIILYIFYISRDNIFLQVSGGDNSVNRIFNILAYNKHANKISIAKINCKKMWGIIIVLLLILVAGYLVYMQMSEKKANFSADNGENVPVGSQKRSVFCCKYDYGPLWYHLTGYPSRSMQGRAWYRLPIRTIDRMWWGK